MGRVEQDTSRWPLVIASLAPEAMDDAELRDFLAGLDAILDHGRAYAIVVDASQVRTAITARQLVEVRGWLVRRRARIEELCVAAVVVVRSALVRGMLAACFRVFRSPSAYRAVGSCEEGRAWAERQLRATGPSSPPPSLEGEASAPAAIPDVAPLLDLFDEAAYLVSGDGEILFANSVARGAHGPAPTWVAAAVSPEGADATKPCRVARVDLDLDAHVVIPCAASLAELPPSLRPIAERLARGLSDKEIAAELDVPIATVRTYVARVYRRLDVHTRSELVRRFGTAIPR